MPPQATDGTGEGRATDPHRGHSSDDAPWTVITLDPVTSAMVRVRLRWI